MEDVLERYNNLKKEAPISNEDFEIRTFDDILTSDEIALVYEQMSKTEPVFIQEATSQKVWHDVLPQEIIKKIKQKIFEIAPEELDLDRMEYSIANYSLKNGYQPTLFPHYDTRDSQMVTFNIKLGENFKWKVFVENEGYDISVGGALIMSGTQQIHWREKIELKEEDYVDMILCFFPYKVDKPLDKDHFLIMGNRTSLLQQRTGHMDPFFVPLKEKNMQFIETARKEGKAVILEKDINMKSPSWKQFLDHFYSSLKQTENLSGYNNSVGQVIFYDSGTLNCQNAHNAIPEVQDFNQKCEEMGGIKGGCSTLINFNKDNITGKHNDPMDRFYWQCIGSTTWKVGLDNEDISYTLEPGDVLFLPKNLFHAVYNKTEIRAGIIFSCMEEENYTC